MNRSVIKTIILLILTALFISGCGWEDDTSVSEGDKISKQIEFLSTSSDVIALKSTGNATFSETATVKFKVFGSDGLVLSGASVVISLATDIVDLKISSKTVTSDANGEVSVDVTSGATVGVFTVIASSSANSSVFAESSEIKITSAAVRSLQFISATPDLIALKGTGGSDLTEISELKFKAIDEKGNIVTGALINFEPSTTVGGLSLSSVSQTTDINGEAKISVLSGNIPTSVSIVASLAFDSNIRVISNHINISTGRPTTKGFNVGPEGSNHVVGALDTFGLEKKIIVQSSDLFGHPVPNGTKVHFRSEWGQIEPSCTIQNGQCSVQWKSGGDETFFNNQSPQGRITIVAFAQGEESFTDVNSNGIYDSEDNVFWNANKDNLSEVFVNKDDIVNGSIYDNNYDYGIDDFIDSNNNNIWDSAPNNIYNGKLCSDSAEEAGLCSKDLVQVWKSNVIIATHTEPVSSSIIRILDSSSAPVSVINLVNVSDGKAYFIDVMDNNGNPLPAGTKISLSVTNPDGTENSNAIIAKKDYTLSNSTAIGVGSTRFLFEIHKSNIIDDSEDDPLKRYSKLIIKIAGEGNNETSLNIDVK